MRKLTPKDFESVHEAIVEVEKKTRGEIVPLILADAGNHDWIKDRAALGGITFALLGGEAWSLLRDWPLESNEMLGLVMIGAILGAAFGMVPVTARWLLGQNRLRHAVHRRALAEFTARGCGKTREETGILVMLALFERQIVIIADRGIQKVAVEKEGAEVWDRITLDFSKMARRGGAVKGLVDVIRRLGLMLEQYFPPDGIAGGELPDELQTE